MSYVTEATAWLSEDISQEVKSLVARFYELADSKQPDAGHLMATEVFAEDGVLVASGGTYRGSQEISQSRDNAWTVVTSRKHTISQAFAGRCEFLELLLLGTVQMDLVNGRGLACRFAAHVKIATTFPSSAGPRIAYMEVFADSAPVAATLAIGVTEDD